jgi:hypothetical protein
MVLFPDAGWIAFWRHGSEEQWNRPWAVMPVDYEKPVVCLTGHSRRDRCCAEVQRRRHSLSDTPS